MVAKEWFIHIQGETVGPLTTDVILVMLKQYRLQFSDFLWAEGLTQWKRASEFDEFARQMPEYPKVPIPSGKASEAKPAQVSAKETATPSKKAKDAPKSAPSKTASKEGPRVRALPRVTLEGKIETQSHGSFSIINLGTSGVFVRASEPLPIGTELKFTLRSDAFEKELEMTGLVIRHGEVDGKKGFAIELTRVNPSHSRLIHEYVERNASSE